MLGPQDNPRFPPLLQGVRVKGAIDPVAKGCALAELGCDAGTVVYNLAADRMSTAIVLAPEVSLEDSMAALPVCGLGLQNALGALAPPEVSVHLGWTGGIFVNGARCGRFRSDCSDRDPDAVPSWLVIGFELQVIPVDAESPGLDPNRTSLFEEGCVNVSPTDLVESWARHTLVWINRWTEEGTVAVHREWKGIARGLGEEITVGWRGRSLEGIFLGVDERFGMLLRQRRDTQLLPLSGLLASDRN